MQQTELESATQTMYGAGPNSKAWEDFNERRRNNPGSWEKAMEAVEAEVGELNPQNPNHRRLISEAYAAELYDGKNMAALDETERQAINYGIATDEPTWGIRSEQAITMAAQDVSDAAIDLYSRSGDSVPNMTAQEIQDMETGIRSRGFTEEGGSLMGQYSSLQHRKNQLEDQLATATGEGRTAIQNQLTETERAITDIGARTIQAHGFDEPTAVSAVAVSNVGSELIANFGAGRLMMAGGTGERYATALGSLQGYLQEQGISEDLAGRLTQGTISSSEVGTVIEKLGLQEGVGVGGNIITDLRADGFLNELTSIMELADIDLSETRVPGEEERGILSNVANRVQEGLQGGGGTSPSDPIWVRMATEDLSNIFNTAMAMISGGEVVEDPEGEVE